MLGGIVVEEGEGQQVGRAAMRAGPGEERAAPNLLLELRGRGGVDALRHLRAKSTVPYRWRNSVPCLVW